MRLKSITKNHLNKCTRAYTNYDGSVWALTNVMAIRLPEDYNLRGDIEFLHDKFIPNMLAYDGVHDRLMMDLDRYIEEHWKLSLRDCRDIVLHIRKDDYDCDYAYNSKYVKMFNWHTDARYRINLSTGLMYVRESITDNLMGLVLTIKLEGGAKK